MKLQQKEYGYTALIQGRRRLFVRPLYCALVFSLSKKRSGYWQLTRGIGAGVSFACLLISFMRCFMLTELCSDNLRAWGNQDFSLGIPAGDKAHIRVFALSWPNEKPLSTILLNLFTCTLNSTQDLFTPDSSREGLYLQLTRQEHFR